MACVYGTPNESTFVIFICWSIPNLSMQNTMPCHYEAPYGTRLIFFYRHDAFYSDSHFTNRNDGFYLSQWWTLLIELKVSIISIAFLSIDRCTHRNFHIDRTIKKHRLIDVMYRSIDTKGPSIDTKGPSIDTKGPSIDTKGPSIDASIDRYEGSIAIDTKGPSIDTKGRSIVIDTKGSSIHARVMRIDGTPA